MQAEADTSQLLSRWLCFSTLSHVCCNFRTATRGPVCLGRADTLVGISQY
jgi:hypothetical protein